MLLVHWHQSFLDEVNLLWAGRPVASSWVRCEEVPRMYARELENSVCTEARTGWKWFVRPSNK